MKRPSFPFPRRAAACLVAGIFALTDAFLPAQAAKVTAETGQITLPTYPWAAVKHPYFRGTDKVNIYPYPMLDFLSREKTNRTYRTVVLENEYLRITFLPELGGKIHEVIDKTTGQPMFYVNHVIKPGLIGQCGAWTSGGVEWNTGPQGHTVGCMQPVAVEILPAEKDGSRSVAIGETERIYGTRWTVVVTLRPDRSFIEERIRIYNPTETVRPYYFWNCTAVPNTPGFRFIYPMTLGTDHGAEKFFNWPLHEGKDLSRGTNYQDASSIFAWHCDQDFFGSYDDGVDRGVVSYANHQQVPGKKAWTWGQGGFGRMHQMDLTDTDGPYNEVQTGPLLTQGEVGRLDPCEAVEWNEWWYPVHGIGGFTFANKDVAVNAVKEGTQLRLRILGTGRRDVRAAEERGKLTGVSAVGKVSPEKPCELILSVTEPEKPTTIQLTAGNRLLARFRVPLDLPKREPPPKRASSESPSELAQAGWRDFLFARFPEAGAHFRKAIEKDPKQVEAHTGLAFLSLDGNPTGAVHAAQAALDIDPDCGLAWLALAVAQSRSTNSSEATDSAWKAALDPATAVPARALLARLFSRAGDFEAVERLLSEPGPWSEDPVCQHLRAFASLRLGRREQAEALANRSLATDPLDPMAKCILFLSGAEAGKAPPIALSRSVAANALDLAAEFTGLNRLREARAILALFFRLAPAEAGTNVFANYWGAYAFGTAGPTWQSSARLFPSASFEKSAEYLATAQKRSAKEAFPHWAQSVDVLRWASERAPGNGQAALYLGHVLFHIGRPTEGREMWKKAVELGAEPVIAHRALGMAALTLDNDTDTALKHLTKAHELDRADSIVARDLAKVLFTQADKADSAERKKEFLARARDALKAAFDEGKGRSDFVSLLGRAQNRLGEYAETARMLDQVRVTVWEGSREVHDLFEDAHLALGEAHLKAGRPAEALVEFNRALEYPDNLATGKLENTREAHIHFERGNALAALGQPQEAVAAWKLAAAEPESKKTAEARRKAKEALEKASTR